MKGVLRRTHRQAQRYRAEVEIAPHRIEQVALVAGRQLIDARAEHDEAGRAGLDLGDVAELDPLAAGCRRGIGTNGGDDGCLGWEALPSL